MSNSIPSIENIVDILKKEISQHLANNEEISIDKGFLQLGLDSLDVMELGQQIEDKFNVQIEPAELFEHSTIHKLATHLHHMLSLKINNNEEVIATDLPLTTNDDIGVIGIGCRFPGGIQHPNDLWQLLLNGEDALQKPLQNREVYKEKHGGFLENIEYFDAAYFGISPREAIYLDPQQRILLEVIWEALQNASISLESIKETNTGVFIGISNNDYRYCLNESILEPSLFYSTGNATSVAAGRISYLLGLHGPSVSIDTACSSSLVAAHMACQSILQGECDIAIVAGVNLILEPTHTNNLTAARMLSPDGRCKSFDKSANGFVRSEGCGVVILAKNNKENVKPLAWIKGSAINQDGHSSGLSAPNIKAQQAVLNLALEKAKINPAAIDYIEAHGSGTIIGDSIELDALKRVYSPRTNPLYIGSIKASIGHCEAASGIAGLIKSVLMLVHKKVPQQLHFKEKNKTSKFAENEAIIPTETTNWVSSQHNRMIGISSFGFSGTNCHMILAESTLATNIQAPATNNFQRQYYWPNKKNAMASMQTISHLHPLIRQKMILANGDILYLGSLNLMTFSYLKGHDIFSHYLFPGAAFCEVLMAIAKDQYGCYQFAIEKFSLTKALMIQENDEIQWQVIVNVKSTRSNVMIYAKNEKDAEWINYASATLIKNQNDVVNELKTFDHDKAEQYNPDNFYQVMESNGIHYGKEFRVIKEIHHVNQHLMGVLECEIDEPHYFIHPTLLDGCFQVGVAYSIINETKKADEMYLPISIEHIQIFKSIPKKIYVFVEVVHQSNKETSLCHLLIKNEEGDIVALIHGLVGKKANLNSVHRQMSENKTTSLTYQKILEKLPIHSDAEFHLGKTLLVSENPHALQQLLKEEDIYVYEESCDLLDLHIDSIIVEAPLVLHTNISESARQWLNHIRVIFQKTTKNKKIQIFFLCIDEHNSIYFELFNAFIKSLTMENSKFKYSVLKINAFINDIVLKELRSFNNESIIYNNNERYVERIQLLNHEKNNITFDSNTCYLITGGMGALGQSTARWLVQHGAKHIILVGRQLRDTSELDVLDANIIKKSLDISNIEEVKNLFVEINNLNIILKGIIHSAGVSNDKLLENIAEGDIDSIWHSKVTGMINIDTAVKQSEIKLDFFICYSSIAAILGSPAQSLYAGANAFVDAFTEMRHKEGKPYYSINWGPWSGNTMADDWAERFQRGGLTPLHSEVNLAQINTLLMSKISKIIVMNIDMNQFQQYFGKHNLFALFHTKEIIASGYLVEVLKNTPEKRHLKIIKDFVKKEVIHILAMEANADIEMNVGFIEMGMDSLMLLELQTQIQKAFADVIELHRTAAFDYPTPNALAEDLYHKYSSQNVTKVITNKVVNDPHIQNVEQLSINELITMIDEV